MFQRTRKVLGAAAVGRLERARAAVVGLGGVGGYAVEALARAPVGALVLIDPDRVCPPDLNRQICALRSTLGRTKARVWADRVRDIRPATEVVVHETALTDENAGELLASAPDVVVDAVDDIEAKTALIRWAAAHGRPLVSSMGAGFRVDPTRVRVAGLFETRGCALARALRRRVRRLGLDSSRVRAVFSEEPPAAAEPEGEGIGSVSWCPGAFGLACAAEAVRLLLEEGL